MLKQYKILKELQDSAGNALSIIPLTPNQWSLLSLLLAIAAAMTIASGNLAGGLLLFTFAAVFDVIDGAVARARNEVSALGGFIDGTVDRFVEAIFLFSFMFYPLPVIFFDSKIWLAGVIFLGTCMPSFIRAYADHKGVISREQALALRGVCERSERMLIIIAGLLAGLLYSMQFFIYALALVLVLSPITIIQRVDRIIRDNRQFQPKMKA